MLKKVMVIGGGQWQVPIIKKAKELGCYVINTNLYEKSEGFKYADVGIVADVRDKDKNLEIAEKYEPHAIITDQSDIAVPTVAYLCEHLGLPGIGYDKARLFTDKFRMREFCHKNGFPTPDFYRCFSLNDIKEAAVKLGFPFMIKPTNNQSSRGVYKIGTIEELEDKYNNTLSYCDSESVLAEQFIGGTEYTVEGFKTAAMHCSLAVSKKKHFKENEVVASRLLYSNSKGFEELKTLNNNLIERMELPFGITHAEYKYWNNDFYLIEVAARGGGTKISSHIVPLLSGVNTNELLIKMALGEKIHKIDDANQLDISAVLEFFVFESGRVKEILGLDKIKSLENVIDIDLNFKKGDYLYPPVDDRSRAGYFIAWEKKEESLLQLIEQIKTTVEVLYE
ncbi:ATP-grasp domain-containing protein [Phosphitispora fastidiosa]|uniref:ATP-grasp domain-containing protein n=1 Tax=Phosphitispora fastidiosa TaxID=2837202 RepID=UPI001E3ED32D|nr:ATP-grasp domain-containing protein [Phosphitispora fastidiosa]MBU7006397.1 biotin carboxylase [Phosphitispora fastidiosa]